MSINIKNKEAERLLGEIKARTGKGTSAVVLDLLRREHERLQTDEERKLAKALADDRELRERWNARPLVDPRPIEEILAYDENGLPK
jgi:hypothetical protein